MQPPLILRRLARRRRQRRFLRAGQHLPVLGLMLQPLGLLAEPDQDKIQ